MKFPHSSTFRNPFAKSKTSVFHVLACVTVIAAIAVLLPNRFSSTTLGQSKFQSDKVQKTKLLPDGKWSVTFHTYFGADADTMPARIFQVQSDAGNDVEATMVAVRNLADKPIAGMRFGWIVKSAETGDAILERGETPRLKLKQELAPGHARHFKYPITSVGKLFKQYIGNGTLDGEYDVQIYVIEVRFSDNSIWRQGSGQSWKKWQSSSGSIKRKATLTNAAYAQCPKQRCVTDTSGTANVPYYSCGTSDYNEGCSVSMINGNARSCTMSTCGASGGGGELSEYGTDEFDEVLAELDAV